MRRSTVAKIVSVSVLALLACGYGAADIADIVPGFLTAAPAREAAPVPAIPEQADAVLAAVATAQGDEVSPTDVRALWSPVERAASEGKWASWGSVIDAATGQVLLDADAATAHTPASTTKVLTAFSAFSTLDTSQKLTTSLLLSGGRLHLTSQGDLLLGEGASNPDAVEGHAGLGDLAAQAAAVLNERGIADVSLTWDEQLFDGESRLAAWGEQGVAGFEGRVGAMAIDAGRTVEGAYAFVDDPSRNVASVVANALTNAGIETSLGSEARPPDGAEAIASVESATMGQQIRWMLHESDNTVADQYCRLAARAAGKDTSAPGAVAHLRSTLEDAGVDTTGMSLQDCSGLSENDKISAATLVNALRASASSSGDLAGLVRSLPWAGLDGTMTSRMSGSAAVANAQAKTGSLGSVSSLAGIVQTNSGRILIYAIGNDAVPDDAAALTRPVLDRFIVGLAEL